MKRIAIAFAVSTAAFGAALADTGQPNTPDTARSERGSTPSQGGEAPQNTENGSGPTAMSQRTMNGRSPLNAQDKAFLGQAVMFNTPAIHAALVAEDQADSPAAKAYARLALSDHNDIANDLSELAGRYGVGLPNPCELGGAADQAINQLQVGARRLFDRAYMTAQAQDDRDAIDLFEQEARSAGDSEVGQFASQTAERLRQHLGLAQLILNTLNRSASR